MRAVVDTNVIVSALIAPAGKPAAILDAWLEGKFTLLTCAEQGEELRMTLQKPRVANLIKPHKAGWLVNQLERFAEHVGALPRVARSIDWRGPQRGYAARPAYARPGLGARRPQAGAAPRWGRARCDARAPCGIARPFAPTLPTVQTARTPRADPTDDFLLALAEAGNADYLVTGDKGGLLALGSHRATRIVFASDFAALLA